MVYSDLIFILGMFPIMTIISLFDRSAEYKNLILIVCSLLFFSWGRPFVFCLIFLSVILDWIFGLIISKNRENKALCGIFLVLDIIMNVSLMLIFGQNILYNKVKKLSFDAAILPLGMGYYMLRGISYVYDVFKGNCKAEKNIFCLLTYMVSLHFMLVGPLVRYGDIEPQIRHREITGAKLNQGLNKIVFGFGKVVLLAGVFEQIKLAGLNGKEITTLGCWLGMLSFLAQYYFLFTGLSDMAKGLGLTNGFVYPDNYTNIEADGLFTGMIKSFNTTVVDFFSEVFCCKKNMNKVFTFVCYILCGLALSIWYQAKVNFIIVGLCAAVLCILEKLFFERPLSKLPDLVKYIYLVLTALVIFGGLYFDSFYGYKKWLFALAGVNVKYTLSVSVKSAVLKNITLIVISFFIVCPPAKRAFCKFFKKLSQKSQAAYGRVMITKTIMTVLVFAVSVITLAAEYAA